MAYVVQGAKHWWSCLKGCGASSYEFSAVEAMAQQIAHSSGCSGPRNPRPTGRRASAR